MRRASTFNTSQIQHLYQDLHDANARLRLLHGDFDSSSLNQIIKTVRPDEV